MADNGADMEFEVIPTVAWIAVLAGIAAAVVIAWRVLTRRRGG